MSEGMPKSKVEKKEDVTAKANESGKQEGANELRKLEAEIKKEETEADRQRRIRGLRGELETLDRDIGHATGQVHDKIGKRALAAEKEIHELEDARDRTPKELKEMLRKRIGEYTRRMEERRKDLLSTEAALAEKDEDFYKNHNVFGRAARQLTGAGTLQKQRKEIEDKTNVAAAEYERALEDRLKAYLKEKNFDDRKAAEFAERYRRRIVSRDVIERGEKERESVQKEALASKERSFAGRALRYLADRNAALDKRLGKTRARMVRALVGASAATLFGPANVTLLGSVFLAKATQAIVGSFGGAIVGDKAGKVYEKTGGARAAQTLAELRTTVAHSADDIAAKRAAYRAGNAEAIERKRRSIETVVAMLSGAGFSLATGYGLAGAEATHAAISHLAHANAAHPEAPAPAYHSGASAAHEAAAALRPPVETAAMPTHAASLPPHEALGHAGAAEHEVGHGQFVDRTYTVHDQDLSGKVEVRGIPGKEQDVTMSFNHTPGSQVLAGNWRETMLTHTGSLTGQDTAQMMAQQIEATKLALDQAVAHGNMGAARVLHESLQQDVKNAKFDFGNIFTAHVTDMPTTHGVVFTEPSHPLPPLTSANVEHLQHDVVQATHQTDVRGWNEFHPGQSYPGNAIANSDIEKHLEHMYASASKAGTQPHLNVAPIHAVTGRGYEEMAYKLGHELHNQYPHGLPNEFANSDAAKLWEAIQQDGTQGHEHLNATLNQLATGHHFLNSDGTSALVGKDAGLTFDAHGNLSFSDAHHASITNASKGMSTTPAYHPEVNAAHEASAEPAEVTHVPTHTVSPPHPATSKPATVPTPDNIVRDGANNPVFYDKDKYVRVVPYQPELGHTATPSPVPEHHSMNAVHSSEAGGHIKMNALGLPVDVSHANAYLDRQGNIIIFGGSLKERTQKALELVTKDHSAVVYFDSTRPAGPFGLFPAHHISEAFWFKGSGNTLTPAGPGGAIQVHEPMIVNDTTDPALRGWRLPSINDLKEVFKPEEILKSEDEEQ